MSRVRCEGCGRPQQVCVCARLVTVSPRTKVVVLQHPREEGNAIGTAWMVERCLGAERVVGIDLEKDPRYLAAIAERAILLSPGPDAIDLREAPPEGPVTLVVIDGTWSQARKLLRVNPSLARLPRYAFQPARPSGYRTVRREPAAHCVSTIEATVAALSYLEPELRAEEALGAFEAMVDHQIRIAGERAESRHKMAAIARAEKGMKGPKPPRRLPLSRDDLVIAYAEANAWPRGTEHGPHPQLVHLVAERLATGERFEAFVTPERPLYPGFSFHSRVPMEKVLGGEPRSEARARFGEFLREGDVLGVWGAYTIDLLRRDGFPVPSCVDVRTTAISFLGRRAGDAAEIATALGCAVDPPWAIGRTGERHAAAKSVARALSR